MSRKAINSAIDELTDVVRDHLDAQRIKIIETYEGLAGQVEATKASALQHHNDFAKGLLEQLRGEPEE